MMVLMTTLLVALLAVAGLTINIAQLEVTRTELRIAADAAAKAGTVVLGQTQSTAIARAEAKQVAALHRVAGRPLVLTDNDIQFGNASRQADGHYQFTADAQPFNSVQVSAAVGTGTASGKVNFFMTAFVDTDNFSLDNQAIATRVDHDVCLVVDRSGSMAWDLSGQEWKYPHVQDSSIIQNYFLKPHPDDSRWASVQRAVDIFQNQLTELSFEARIGLVSFSSNFVFGLFESEASTIESGLTTDYDTVTSSLSAIGSRPLIGNTNIASGMQDAVVVLTGNGSRITAKATMVVLTDGVRTQGIDPIKVAQAAAAANITVHTITFSDQADQNTMREVAAVGGGNHYHAPDDEALQSIFREIAETLPSILVQ
jgi:Mg-chelatase subunit ChlD